MDDEPGDSSLPESSPVKHHTSKKSGLTKHKKRNLESMKNKKMIAKCLAMSSADEDESSQHGSNKRKQTHQRRPVTRRQKSGVKKTIPTTTVFNQR